MKNRWFTQRMFILVLLFVGFISYSNAQEWKNNLPQNKVKNHTLTLKDYQKAFYGYFKEAKAGEAKATKEGEEKDETLEKFKRWEWYWETRVNPVTGAFPRTTAYDVYQQYLKTHPNTTNVNSQQWRSKGPVESAGGTAGLGRINCVAFSPVDTSVLYVGSASGGVWKTTDGGANWIPLGDFNKTLGVSDMVVVNDGGDDIIYLGTGDKDHWDARSVGVLKSTDGGQTWDSTGLQWDPGQGSMVYRLLVDPGNDSILYAATNNGLYKTTDAGQHWNIVNYRFFRDLEFQPGSSTRMYGSELYDGAIYYSTDAGQTWTKAIDNPDYSRTELAVSRDSANVVYAVMASNNNGLLGIYRSKDAGQTYTLVFNSLNLLGWSEDGSDYGGQGWYDLTIAVDPHDANKIFVGGVNTWMSEDGGKSWELSNYWDGSFNGLNNAVHADKHDLVYQSSTNTLFECNDGGIYKTNNGKNWDYIGSGLAVSQIYRLGTSATVAGEVITGLQDNGTKLLSGNSWNDVLGGDGMECLIDYTNDSTQYGEIYYGQIYRTKDHWQSRTRINSGLWGNAAWVTPYVINPINHKTLYAGYQDVFKSTNQGSSWVKLSNFGGWQTLRSMAVSASDTNSIYAATLSIIYKTTDGGKTWHNITANLPVDQADITYVTIKNNDPNTVWVTMGGYNNLGVFETINGGNSWHDISSGLPAIPVNSITQNKLHGSTELFAGTDVGVFVRKGDSTWQPFNSQLPNVVVDELEIHYDSTTNATLYAATFGRGLWAVDISGEINDSLSADFRSDSVEGTAPLTVHFTDLSSGQPDLWKWDFGDGSTDTVQNPVHTYKTPGTYTVTEIVKNNNASDTLTKADLIWAKPLLSPLADSLKHYYKFDGTLKDEVGNVNGINNNVNEDSTGIINQCVYLSGNNYSYVETYNWSAFNFCHDGSDFTISVWERHNSSDPSSKCILGNDIGGDRPGVFFSVDSTDVSFMVGRYYPYPAFSHAWTSVLPSDTVQWNHLVITYDHTLDSNQYTLYVNGKNAGSASRLNSCESGNSFNPMRFGINKTTGTIQPFKGELDEFGFWDRTLNASEIGQLYNSGKGLAYPLNDVADFTADTTAGLAPLTVRFTDKSTNYPTSWLWDFGNGDTSHLQNPVVTYDSVGYYTVTLTTSNGQDTVLQSKKDYIKVKKIISRFTADTTAGVAPLTVHFTNRSVGNPDSLAWDFNDDGVIDSTSQNPSWTYSKPGLYSVALYVSNNQGKDTLVKKDYIHVDVNIPDTNFRKVINERLGYTYPKTLTHNPTKKELATITDLYASNRGITDITGAEYLVNCTALSFDNDQITSNSNSIPGINHVSEKDEPIVKNKIYFDSIVRKKLFKFTKTSTQPHRGEINKINNFSPLAGLTKLEHLSLQNTGISDISFLSGLTNLTQLILWDNSVTNIDALSNLTNLRYLDLDNNQVTNISALSNMINLQTLWFDNNKPGDISALSNLVNLGTLGLGSDSISNISPLSNLTRIGYLLIYNNNISDLGPIQSLTNLYSLNISSNKISDASSLTGLTNLQYLYLGNNPIHDLSFLNKITQLRNLDIEGLHLNDLPFTRNFPSLTYLNIYGNNLSSLKGIENCPVLDYLYASSNPLYDIRGIETLPLYYFYAEYCRISDFAPLVENARIKGELQSLYLSGNPASFEAMEKQIPVLQASSYGDWPQEDSLAACYPVPHNEAVYVSDTVSLTWQANFNHKSGVTYDVYLDTNFYNQPLVAQGLTTTSYHPILKKGKNYWWRIESISNGDTVRSGVWYFNTDTSAQIITADPVFPTDNKVVTLTFNAALGDAGLKDFSGFIYAHTGVITDKSTSPSDWRYVKADWNKNISACRMTRIDTNLYQLKFSPSIRAFYGVPLDEQIRKLAFVFRSAYGSQTGRMADGGDVFYNVYVDSTQIPQKISLGQGWNIMSFNITPDTLSLLSMLQHLVNRNELVKVMDEKGNFIQDVPGTGWVNTIGDMANTEGYYIKVAYEDAFYEAGCLVKLPYDIPLEKGWNMMGYPLQSSQDAKAALKTLIDSSYFIKVVDESGGLIQNINGVGWINTIGNFEPGKGYYVKVSGDTHITLNKTTKEVVSDRTFTGKPVLISKYFNKAFKGNPYFPMNIIVSKLSMKGYTVQPGDEIAAYDNGVCVGTGVVSKDITKPVIIVASMDDPSTTQQDGFSTGDKISFRYMSPRLNSPLTLTANAQSGQLLFTPLGTIVCGITASPDGIKDLKSEGYRLHIYPNPAKGYAVFEINNVETARLRVEILNLNGKVVHVLCDKFLTNENFHIRYNTSILPAGIYDVRVVRQTEKQTSINNYKMVITR